MADLFNNSFIGTAQERYYSRIGTAFSADNRRDYIRTFRVKATSPRIGANEVADAPGIPDPFDHYRTADGMEEDKNAFLVRISPERRFEDEHSEWDVKCYYSTEMPEGGLPIFVPVGLGKDIVGLQNNPELQPAKIKWTTEIVNIAMPYDMTGRAFTNTAGSPLDPPPTMPVARVVLTLTRNELGVDRRSLMSKYLYSVNCDPFAGANPGTALIQNIDCDERYLGAVTYFRTTYRIVFNHPKWKARKGFPNLFWAGVLSPAVFGISDSTCDGDKPEDLELETWDPQFLNAGREAKIPDGLPYAGLPGPILKNGVPISHPALLAEDGTQLQRDAAGNYHPVFLRFRVHKRRNFQKLFQKDLHKIGG